MAVFAPVEIGNCEVSSLFAAQYYAAFFEEAEQVLLGFPLDMELQIADESNGEERLLQIGETAKGRILQLVTTWRDGKVRVITVWDDVPKQLKDYYLAEMRRQYGDT